MFCPGIKCGHYSKATKYPRKCYYEVQCWRGMLDVVGIRLKTKIKLRSKASISLLLILAVVVIGTATPLTASEPLVRSATLVVAASNASVLSRSQADYVADGTGDQVEIQAAIDALPIGGGKVMLSEGIFSISAPVILKASNTTLAGRGRSTVLKAAVADIATGIVYDAAPLTGIVIEDMTFDGGRLGTKTVGVTLGAVRDFVVRGNRFVNLVGADSTSLYIGVLGVAQNTRGTVANNYFENSQRGVGTVGQNITIIGNVFSGLSGEGIELATPETYSNTVVGNIFLNSGTANAYVGAIDVSYNSSRNNITGNSIWGGNYGVLLGSDAWGNQVNSNHLSGQALAAIAVMSFSGVSRNNTISNNTITDFNSANYGILIDANCPSNVISDNYIYMTGLPGVGIRLNSSLNRVVGNNLVNATLLDNAAGNTIFNNSGYLTENSGVGVIASGATSVTLNHGLSIIPVVQKFRIVYANNPSNSPGHFWIDAITATQFRINVMSDPGSSGLNVGWSYSN